MFFRPTLPTEATQWPAGSGFPYYVEQSPLLVYGDGMETGGDHCRRLLGRSRGSSASPYLIRQTAKMDNRYPDVLVGGGAAPAPVVGAGVQPY